MTEEMLALKPYLEKIKKHCANLTKEELIDVLCQAALDVPTAERTAFLAKLSISSSPVNFEEISTKKDDSILARTEKLIKDIGDWQESIEDGSYYDKYYEDEDDYYDEELPSMSKEQHETLEALFAEADKLFLAGKLEIAGKTYQQLINLALHGGELDYWIEHNEIDINWQETLARYCRCVYETSSEAERPERMLAAMEAERKTEAERDVFGIGYNPAKEFFPSFQNVFDARPGELAGWDDFLRKMQKELCSISSSRAVLLYMEAVHWLDGLQGLTAAVRQCNHPTGYLYWLDQLREAEAWGELAVAAQEALSTMPYDSLRAYAAAQLSVAGEQTGDSSLVLQGKREQFFSKPQEEHLADLLREATKQQVSDAELTKVLAFLEAVPAPAKNQRHFSLFHNQPDFFSLRIKTMLLLGKLRESYAAIDQKAAIGWSDEKKMTGAVYVGILLVLSKGNAAAKTIHSLFTRYMRGQYGNTFIADAIQKHLLQLSLSSTQEKEWLQFTQEISTARAEHIVSNQYRKGYARGAEALGGYMECLILHGQQDQAAEFLDLKRNQQYKRYPAFRRELDDVVKSSPLLSSL